MYLLGTFVGQQFPKGADQDDLDFFAFPEIDPAVGTDAVEAPIDGFMMREEPKNEDGAKQLLEYLGTPEAEDIVPQGRPERHRRHQQGRHLLLHRAAEEGGRDHRLGRVTSPSSWTATPGPTSPRTVMHPGAPEVHQEPQRHRRR